LPVFRFVEALGGVCEVDGAGLDFDRNASATEIDNEIQFASSDDEIASMYRGAEPHRSLLNEVFAEPADLTFQIRTPGSNSSILTSRKLSTLTFCRNRAGRYISHTHASSKRISKNTDPSTERWDKSTLLAR